jgi:phosphopantothenoylcysteine decarboxylase/phosphopantothenate--cysteine ligase
MNCIITAGPTYERLDEVRRLTNFSTGSLGSELASYLTSRGHQVTLLIGEQATYRGEREAKVIQIFSTTTDLRDRLEALKGKKIDAIFHAAAVSDFTFGKLLTQNAAGKLAPLRRTKKISTRSGSLFAELVPTPKIIAELRHWYPSTIIIGWKFEANGKRADALASARRQMGDCNTDACVANGPAYGNGFALVTEDGQKHLTAKPQLFRELESFVTKKSRPET